MEFIFRGPVLPLCFEFRESVGVLASSIHGRIKTVEWLRSRSARGGPWRMYPRGLVLVCKDRCHDAYA